MPKVCFYFQLHQPFRLADVSVFDLGTDRWNYFDGVDDNNKLIFNKVAEKSYLPMLSLLLELVQQQPDFYFSMSTSGVFLEQAQRYNGKVIKLLQALLATGQVELLAETYHHSLAGLYSPAEFGRQIQLHQEFVDYLFGYTPVIFRNTELIYSNDVAHLVSQLGFKGMLTEAVGRYLGDRPKTKVYWSDTQDHIPILLKHAELSDDVAFRFSNRGWHHHPLSSQTYLHWIEQYGHDEYINLFMDFETFGEHQWADTGIFEFFRHFVQDFVKKDYNTFVTPRQVLEPLYDARHPIKKFEKHHPAKARFHKRDLPDPKLPAQHQIYSVVEPISWADVDRDLTAWRDNSLQTDTLRIIYEMEQPVLSSGNPKLIEEWRKLQTSDHFYYMCTKWSADGDVHAYFSPYDSPYDAYRRYSLALAHLQEALL